MDKPIRPSGPGGARTAILWLTSFEDPEADAAYARLKAEATPWGDVTRVRHQSGAAPLSNGTDDLLTLVDAELKAALPSRYAEMTASGTPIEEGLLDILQMAVMDRLAAYDRVWFIEYDVDFSGDWSRFFSSFAGSGADLLCTMLRPRAQARRWTHWRAFRAPPGSDPGRQLRGFHPVVRLSRRFAERYRSEVRHGWAGHYEALYPTIAAHLGLVVEDIGGEGPLTPAERRGRFYTGGAHHSLTAGTFRFRPPVARTYHQDAARTPADHLWHPVKTRAYLARRRR